SRAWTCPLPSAARLSFGAVLLLAVLALALAAPSQRSYHPTRLAAAASPVLLPPGTTAVAAVLLRAPAPTPPLPTALAATPPPYPGRWDPPPPPGSPGSSLPPGRCPASPPAELSRRGDRPALVELPMPRGPYRLVVSRDCCCCALPVLRPRALRSGSESASRQWRSQPRQPRGAGHLWARSLTSSGWSPRKEEPRK